jgi:hypothetical protein
MHGENHSKARLSGHHLGVTFRSFLKRHGLDHGSDDGEHTKL